MRHDDSLSVLSAASAGERKGPIAKQWVGEVVADKHAMLLVQSPQPTTPSPRYARVPSLSPHATRGRRARLIRTSYD
jgi:hypothetical protein